MSLYDKASLVLIPSGTKTSKVYSQKPTNGDGDFTFSRSTAATRVNASGNIEKETQNLITYSNTFSNAAWAKNGTSVTSGQSGYDGSSDASLLNGSGGFARLSGSISVSGVFTISVYAKANTTNYLDINMLFDGVGRNVVFDLVNGVKTAQDLTPISDKITDVGNGWWRIEVTLNGNLGGVSIGLSTDGTIGGWVNFTSGSFYIQDYQVEQSLVARDYIETTTTAIYGGITDNVPRLDYTDSSCPALLLEPLRTNLATLSEHIGGWSNKSNATTTSNYTTSPEGIKNATRLQFTANGYLYNQNAPAQVIGAKYTLSCYAKRNDSGTQSFGFFTNGSGAVNSAMALTSEWKRFDYTYTASTASQLGLAGVQGADVSVYGFQVEKDADYPTSYIPTYGSAVTRNAETNHLFDVDDNSIISDPTNFTAYFELELLGSDASADKIRITDSTASPRAYLYWSTAGVTSWSNSESLPTNSIVKFAYRADSATSISFYENGAKTETFTDSGSNPLTIDRLLMYGSNGAFRVHQVVLFNSRLTDQEAIDLTTI